jgi:cytoskeletal protein RodZ
MSTGIGETFSAARRRRGCTLTDASDATKMRETYLVALEQEEFATLGSHVYVRGFISSYAKFLGLDPAPLLDAYAQAHQQPEQRGAGREAPPDRGAEPTVIQIPVIPLAVVGAIVLLVILVLVLYGGDGAAAGMTAGVTTGAAGRAAIAAPGTTTS